MRRLRATGYVERFWLLLPSDDGAHEVNLPLAVGQG